MARRAGIKNYAVDLVKEIRTEIDDKERLSLPALDFGDVLSISPNIIIGPHHSSVEYDDEYLMWQIDPDTLEVGDTVVIGRDPSGQPVVIGSADGNNEDPFNDPDLAILRDRFLDLEVNSGHWRTSVGTIADLPLRGNQDGDLRFVKAESAIYAWDAEGEVWIQIGGSSSGDFVDESGDTMTGDLIMASGTVITLTDAPTVDTDATNKKYVDDAVAAVSVGSVVAVTVVNSNYAALATDRVILVDATGGSVTVTLPASHAAGKIFEIKDQLGAVPGSAITISTADSDTIDGDSSETMTTAFQSVTVVSDGTNWSII